MKKVVIWSLAVLVWMVCIVFMLCGCDSPGVVEYREVATTAKTVPLPEPSGYVVDTVGLLKPEQIASLEELLKSFDNTAQIAICIVDSIDRYGVSIEEYGIQLGEKWKVGYGGKDNGVIIILAKNDRNARIEVGTGLEAKLTDSEAGRILDNVIFPKFKGGAWYEGFYAGVQAIQKEVK